jgi:hypothetical protein
MGHPAFVAGEKSLEWTVISQPSLPVQNSEQLNKNVLFTILVRVGQ